MCPVRCGPNRRGPSVRHCVLRTNKKSFCGDSRNEQFIQIGMPDMNKARYVKHQLASLDIEFCGQIV